MIKWNNAVAERKRGGYLEQMSSDVMDGDGSEFHSWGWERLEDLLPMVRASPPVSWRPLGQ